MLDDYKTLEGRCLTCGFLSKWEPAGSIFHIGMPDRLKGKAYRHFLPQGEIVTLPFCFRGAVAFETEDELGLMATRPAEERDKAAADVFQRDRRCPKWYPYRPGFSPQAHLEELRMLELEQRRENFEQRMEAERRGFEWSLAAQAEKAERKRYKVVIWVALAAFIFAVLQVAAAILALGEDSWIVKLLGLD